MRRHSGIFILAAILSIIWASLLQAGELSDQLEKHIAGLDAGEYVRVLIIPVSDHDPVHLKNTLAENFNTRAERHRAGIEQLRAVAEISQSAILNNMQGLKTAAQAKNIKSFWIANLIEADLTVEAIHDMVANPTVEKIDKYPTIVTTPSIVNTDLKASFESVGYNLRKIKADSAWAAGYDGKGRIVCSFDTGVEGDHPALASNYRGNKGYPASECWFSPVDGSVFPQPYTFHGTHTTGIMVGHWDDSNLVVGVAPGADWIAAVAIDILGASIFESYQWAADPDGDPNTIDDVPDVINCSWGIPSIGCSDILWQVIDNTEALGIVNIFSAGNDGPDTLSLRNPANRADDSLTNFAVGALDSNSVIWNWSSRGPSDCDSVSIKPNVTAPGVNIYSSTTNGGYRWATGTSGAAPHVSGAVAILRQKNPDATVDEIKTALLMSAVDLGAPGPDNTFGWGLIDIMEALRLIDPMSEPSLQVANLPYPEISPGDIVNLELTLKNVGGQAKNVRANFGNPEPGVTILGGTINFGTIEPDSFVTNSTTLDLEFDAGIKPGAYYSIDMFVDGNGFEDTTRLSFFVGSVGERTYFDHDTGLVKFTISNYGAFGFHDGSLSPYGFEGYQFDRDTNDLYEAALLIGVDSMHVSDCAKNIVQEPDNDFAVSPGGSIISLSPGPLADQQTVSLFNDSYAENPLGLEIEQRSYGWASDPDNTFIILEYIITNTSKIGVNGVRVGLYFDWDIRTWYLNHGSFLPDDNIGYLCWFNGGDSADFRGVKVLNSEGLANHRVYDSDDETYFSEFTEARKYQGLADNSQGSIVTPMDVAHVTATGPFNLSVQQSDTAAFAIIAGADWDAFMACAIRAEQKYNDIPTDVDDNGNDILPRAFTLKQNFPNPFNPSTTITFALPKSGQVRVDVFDILGRKTKTIFDNRLTAGEHSVVWDGTDNNGDAVASGIYFYRVNYDDNSITRKMVMMK